MFPAPTIHDSDKGLTTQQARERQHKYGRNIIPVKNVSAFQIVLRQFKSAIVILMLIATVISWIVGDHSGAIIIGAIIVINTIVGFYQEYKAEKRLYDISKLVQPTAIVKRDGVFTQILREDVVVGDTVQLTPGTIAPADMELTFAEGLSINESSISGESFDVQKDTHKNNTVEMGTVVTQGLGEGTVTAIGANAVLGEIVNLAETNRPTNFEREVRKLTELCIGIIIVTAALLFIVKLYINPAQAVSIEFLIFLLAIAIGILPESLPLITTVALSNGAMKLSKLGVVVRTLSAIQDLGSITVLCSDKTGTLTENTLTVSDTHICDKDGFDEIMQIAVGLSSLIHDPFQYALRDVYKSKKKTGVKLLHSIPFDATRRSASFIVMFGKRELTVSQGAYEVIRKDARDCDDKHIGEWIQTKESVGERILAFSITEGKKKHIAAIVSFRDPIRSTAKASVEHAHKLGVNVKVISGDSEIVTGAVTKELGLIHSFDQVVSGKQWEKADEKRKELLAKERFAFARFYPVQKYELIRILQKQGQVVGYMGDGVNDAPSLKLADVGICVANGTDIAKNSSDIILLKSGLGVVISGIHKGRGIFENISKYIRETLTENLGNFLSISILSFFIPYLPMLPVQILVANLLTDFPHLGIATDHVDPSAVRIPRRFNLLLLVRFMFMLSLISSGADMLYFVIFHSFPSAMVQTGWFVFSTLAEILTVFSVRSRRYAFQGVGPSALLAFSSLLIVIVTVASVYISPIGSYLHLVPLPVKMLGIIVIVLLGYFIFFDFVKKKIYERWPESY